MPDGPGSAIEKLYAYRTDHFLMGKEFDERALRRNLGLPPVDNPEFLAETPDRKRLVRLDDREAQKELAKAQQEQRETMAKDAHEKLVAEHQSQRIADLEAQIAAMQNQQGSADTPSPSKPASGKAETPLATGENDEPTSAWTIKQVLDFMEAKGLPLPEKKGFGMTKVAVLEFYLEKKAEAEQAGAA